MDFRHIDSFVLPVYHNGKPGALDEFLASFTSQEGIALFCRDTGKNIIPLFYNDKKEMKAEWTITELLEKTEVPVILFISQGDKTTSSRLSSICQKTSSLTRVLLWSPSGKVMKGIEKESFFPAALSLYRFLWNLFLYRAGIPLLSLGKAEFLILPPWLGGGRIIIPGLITRILEKGLTVIIPEMGDEESQNDLSLRRDVTFIKTREIHNQ